MSIMATINFDTLKYIKTLEKAGYTRAQAEAQVEANAEMFAELLEGSLASKGDVLSIKSDIRELELRLIIKMGTMMIALGGVMAIIKFFG